MSKKSGLVVLVSLFAGGCAATFTSNRPKEVTLKDTYDPSAVRDAAAHVLFRAHLEVVAENDRSLSAAEAPCGYTIEYRDRGFVVRAAPLAPRADGLIDGRCLDTEDKLAKHIVKEVERPARLAVKEEKRRRRAERTAA
ncbi:MAG TPA: hypothetical protein VFF06_35990, partial [Polyangia bacterium]|nr:hypothetical protein [Polyangia bacterium]